MRSVVTDWFRMPRVQHSTKIVLVKKPWSGPTHGVGPRDTGLILCVCETNSTVLLVEGTV